MLKSRRIGACLRLPEVRPRPRVTDSSLSVVHDQEGITVPRHSLVHNSSSFEYVYGGSSCPLKNGVHCFKTGHPLPLTTYLKKG